MLHGGTSQKTQSRRREKLTNSYLALFCKVVHKSSFPLEDDTDCNVLASGICLPSLEVLQHI
jgi:hypothetical protein